MPIKKAGMGSAAQLDRLSAQYDSPMGGLAEIRRRNGVPDMSDEQRLIPVVVKKPPQRLVNAIPRPKAAAAPPAQRAPSRTAAPRAVTRKPARKVKARAPYRLVWLFAVEKGIVAADQCIGKPTNVVVDAYLAAVAEGWEPPADPPKLRHSRTAGVSFRGVWCYAVTHGLIAQVGHGTPPKVLVEAYLVELDAGSVTPTPHCRSCSCFTR